jgi:hypothetical protein
MDAQGTATICPRFTPLYPISTIPKSLANTMTAASTAAKNAPNVGFTWNFAS